MKIKYRIEGFRWWLGEALVDLARKIDPETNDRMTQYEWNYRVCVKIARGEIKGQEARDAAFASVY